MLGLVESFSDRQLAFLWEQTVPHYWLLKRKLAGKFNLSYCYTDDLIFSIIKDLRSSFLIFTSKNSLFLRLQNLLQLLLTSTTYFLLEMRQR